MDWDSSSTKKHTAEAKDQGCKLLGSGNRSGHCIYELPCGHTQEIQRGAMRDGRFSCKSCLKERLLQEARENGCELIGIGKNTQYRCYRLKCGHEQEVRTERMRTGSFRCEACLAARLENEAKAQGCELVGSGTSAQNRRYQLPCGHQQEIATSKMRTRGFRCKQCLEQRLVHEASEHHCKLLGPGRSVANRRYRLPCGHDQEVETRGMRTGSYRCTTCVTEKLNREAKAQGCEILGPSRNVRTRHYRLPCGHEKHVSTGSMRLGNFKCQTCFDAKMVKEAAEQGCELIGAGESPSPAQKSSNYRLYRLPCGHVQNIKTSHFRDRLWQCQICLKDKLNQEAAAQGCAIVGKGRDFLYRRYRLPCGHEREVTLNAMRLGTFVCQDCEETSRTLPSKLYLLHIKVDPVEWLKLGYAKSVDFRVTRYGLPSSAEVTVVKSIQFLSGNESHSAEAEIHRRHLRKRLPPKEMEAFHTMSGSKECYPLTMLDTLLQDFEVVSRKQAEAKNR